MREGAPRRWGPCIFFNFFGILRVHYIWYQLVEHLLCYLSVILYTACCIHIMNRVFLIFLIFIIVLPALSAQQEIIYFYEEGCPLCEKVSLLLEELSKEYSLTIIKYDVGTTEGYTTFKQHGFTVTPALLVNGKPLEGEIEKADIVKALQYYEWYHYLVALGIGVISGLSPTLLIMHADIITEVARTTRQELDVVVRSVLFYVGIFCCAFCLFFVFDVVSPLHFVAVLLGFAISVNLLNSGLHSFNSYTNIDLYIKAKFITLDSDSVFKMGFLHGVAKFSDSVPLFIPLMYCVITRGAFTQDVILALLFCAGIILSYCILFVLALVQVNLFRTFRNELVSQVYFSAAGLVVMAASVWLLWGILDALNVGVAFVLTVIVVVASGVLIGFKRRIIY